MADEFLQTWDRRIKPLQAAALNVRACPDCGHAMLVFEAVDETPFALAHVGGADDIEALIEKLRCVQWQGRN